MLHKAKLILSIHQNVGEMAALIASEVKKLQRVSWGQAQPSTNLVGKTPDSIQRNIKMLSFQNQFCLIQ